MQLHRVLVITLIYTETVLIISISANSVRRKIPKKPNINNQGILTKKGRKIQLTKEGHLIICGIDSLEDDYYGCTTSYEDYVYKADAIGQIGELKQVTMVVTEGGQYRGISNSRTTGAPIETKPATVVKLAYQDKIKTSDQARLFLPRAVIKPSDLGSTISTSTNSQIEKLKQYATGEQYKEMSHSMSTIALMETKSTPVVKLVYHDKTKKLDQARLFTPRTVQKQSDSISAVSTSTNLQIEKLKEYAKGEQYKEISHSMSTAALMETKSTPVVKLAYYNKIKTSDQARLFTPRAVIKQSDLVSTVSTGANSQVEKLKEYAKGEQYKEISHSISTAALMETKSTPVVKLAYYNKIKTSDQARLFTPRAVIKQSDLVSIVSTGANSQVEKLKQYAKGEQYKEMSHSMSTAALMETKPATVVKLAYKCKMKTSDQAGLFSPRAVIKQSANFVAGSTNTKQIKNTKSSTTPIFATSAETYNRARTYNEYVSNLFKLNKIFGIPRRMTSTTKSNLPRWNNHQSNTNRAKEFVDTHTAFTHLFNY